MTAHGLADTAVQVGWAAAQTFERRELRIPVVGAPPIERDTPSGMPEHARLLTPDLIDIGFGRRDGGPWQIAYCRVSGRLAHWPGDPELRIVDHQIGGSPAHWPGWLRDLVATIRPVDDPTVTS